MITKGMLTSNKDDWETPQDLFDKLNSFYGFTLDACASPQNAKCKKILYERAKFACPRLES